MSDRNIFHIEFFLIKLFVWTLLENYKYIYEWRLLRWNFENLARIKFNLYNFSKKWFFYDLLSFAKKVIVTTYTKSFKQVLCIVVDVTCKWLERYQNKYFYSLSFFLFDHQGISKNKLSSIRKKLHYTTVK